MLRDCVRSTFELALLTGESSTCTRVEYSLPVDHFVERSGRGKTRAEDVSEAFPEAIASGSQATSESVLRRQKKLS